MMYFLNTKWYKISIDRNETCKIHNTICHGYFFQLLDVPNPGNKGIIMVFSENTRVLQTMLIAAIVLMIPLVSACNKKNDEFDVYAYDKKFQKFIPAFPVLAQEILDHAQKSKGVCIDIGCGPGYLGIAIAERSNFQVHSLDISPAAIEFTKKSIAEKNLGGRVFPVVGDVHKLPYADAFAELVVSRGSLPFWRDKARAFREIHRVLRPGGIAFIGCGFGSGYIHIPENRASGKKPPKKFSHESILKALTEAGIGDYTAIDDNNRGYWIIIRKP